MLKKKQNHTNGESLFCVWNATRPTVISLAVKHEILAVLRKQLRSLAEWVIHNILYVSGWVFTHTGLLCNPYTDDLSLQCKDP